MSANHLEFVKQDIDPLKELNLRWFNSANCLIKNFLISQIKPRNV